MKRAWNRAVWMGTLGLVCGGLAWAAVQQGVARDRDTGRKVQVTVNDKPPARDGRLPSSYSGIVKASAPSVVNIFTTKTVRAQGGMGMNPFFDDPMFRRFFGGPFGDGGNRAPRSFKQRSLGSGVIVTQDGYLLTNHHVVDGADEIKVARESARQEYTAKVVGRDPQTDLAVLKVEAEGLPFATFGDSDHVEVGDVVLAIGNPFGVGQTVTSGIVSAVGRGGMGIEDYEDFIQTDAAINPGNSGGALIDAEGRLIGINTAILSGSGSSAGVGFAIPANLVRSVMNQLIEKGAVERGYLGVGIQDLTPELAREFDIDARRGALVTEVTEDSAAATAGLERGDVITAFNGKPVEDGRSLRLMVGGLPPGSTANLKAVRDGREKSFKVTLKGVPDEARRVSRNRGSETPGAEDEGALTGVAVGDVTPAARQQFSLPARMEGAVILQVDPESASANAGLRPGDVIQEINRKPVRNAEEAINACRESRGDRTLVRLWRQGGHRYVVVNEKPNGR